MDEEDAEEVVKGPASDRTSPSNNAPAAEGDVDKGSASEGTSGQEEPGTVQVPEVKPEDTPLSSTEDEYQSDGSMDAEDAAAGGDDGAANELVAKRPRKESAVGGDAVHEKEETALKGPAARKKRLEVKSNIHVSERRPPKPPS